MDTNNLINLQAKNFLNWLVGAMLCGAMTVTVFVICIDPYNLYGWFKRDGINSVKPDLSRYLEEIKLTQAANLNPDTLIFGNSRAEIGFDPESPALIRRGFSAYNLAIRGTSIALSNRQLDYLLHKGLKPKRLFIAVDFGDFISAGGHSSSNPQPVTAAITTDFPVEHWPWHFDSLFSITSIKDAVRTLLIQNDNEAATMTRRGFNPLREYQAMARNEGYFVLFRQRAEDNAKNYRKKAMGKFDRTDLGYLRAMLKKAVDVGSEVIVIIYPYHAQLLILFEELGLLPSFAQWKNEIVAETERFSKLPGAPQIRVVDFSGYGIRQCEPIPGKDDLRSVTQWYWEAGHFKKALGDIVLERALALAAEPLIAPQDKSKFGINLSGINLALNSERMADEKNKCAETYPQLFKETKALTEVFH